MKTVVYNSAGASSAQFDSGIAPSLDFPARIIPSDGSLCPNLARIALVPRSRVPPERSREPSRKVNADVSNSISNSGKGFIAISQ
jgi:hypothetical protein